MSDDRYVLTDDDVSNTYNLQKLGALAGDEVVDGHLVRVVSEEPKGEILTAWDISQHQNLQDMGAEVGDQVVDNHLVKNADNAKLRNFQYHMQKADGILGKLGTFMKSHFPYLATEYRWSADNGFEIVRPEQMGITGATPDERRQQLLDYKVQQLAQDFPDIIPKEASVSGFAGTIAGSVDPTDLLLAKRPIQAGLALGATYDVADQLQNTGEFTPQMSTAISTGVGGLTGGVVKMAPPVAKAALATTQKVAQSPVVQAPKSVLTNVLNKPSSVWAKRQERKSEEAITAFQTTMREEIAKGRTPQEAFNKASEKMSTSELAKAMERTGMRPAVPETQKKANELLKAQAKKEGAFMSALGEKIDDALGALTTRLGNIAPELKTRMRKFEFDAATMAEDKLVRVKPFIDTYRSLDANVARAVDRALLNGKFKEAEKLLGDVTPDAKKMIADVRSVLGDAFDELKSVGHGFSARDNYFPRKVMDFEGLRAELGAKQLNAIDDALKKFAKQYNTSVEKLKPETKAEIYNKIMRGYKVSQYIVKDKDGKDLKMNRLVMPSTRNVQGRSRSTQARKLEDVNFAQSAYYANSADALSMYVRESANEVAKRRLLGIGKNITPKMRDEGGIDIDATIGHYVQRLSDDGRISANDIDTVKKILQARLGGGEQAMGVVGATLRDTTYAATIANPISAIKQMTDLAHPMRLYGFKNTIQTMFGNKDIKMVDLGIDRAIADEMTGANPRKASAALNWFFDKSGFSKIDRLGKETTINAGINKLRAQANNPTELAKLREKYEPMFGERFEALVADLKTGEKTDLVKELAFNVLADLQPIARSENPLYYNKVPAARLAYQLKTYTLKQHDIIRREIVQEAKEGSKLEAARKATWLAGYYTALGVPTTMVTDMMLGRDVDVDEIPERAMWNLVGTLGMNKYTYDKYVAQGEIGEAVKSTVFPAGVTAPLNAAGDVATSSEDNQQWMRHVPIAGNIMYNWFGGGKEKYNERKAQKEQSPLSLELPKLQLQ